MTKGRFALAIMAVLAVGLLALTACSGQSTAAGNNSNPAANSVTAKQVGIKAVINGDTVAIPVSEVEKNINTRFLVNTATSKMSFMAYKYNNQVQVRADICPPCGSESFTLKNGTLVCDTCGTVFNAATGAGISGACVRYPKQSVQYQVTDGNLVMNGSDLATAFQKTIKPQ